MFHKAGLHYSAAGQILWEPDELYVWFFFANPHFNIKEKIIEINQTFR